MGCSQAQFGTLFGVNQSTIYRWENAKGRAEIQRIVLGIYAMFAGCSVEHLVNTDGETHVRSFTPTQLGQEHFRSCLKALIDLGLVEADLLDSDGPSCTEALRIPEGTPGRTPVLRANLPSDQSLRPLHPNRAGITNKAMAFPAGD